MPIGRALYKKNLHADVQTRLVLYTVDRALSYAIIALNAFPLFGLMLRLKEPSRLPGRSVPRCIPAIHFANMSSRYQSLDQIIQFAGNYGLSPGGSPSAQCLANMREPGVVAIESRLLIRTTELS